jgi:hypothetical protein
MPDHEPQPLDLTEIRDVSGILGTAVRTYLGYPSLFILLAAMVLVPYQLITLAINISGPTYVILLLVNLVVIVPLISALQMHALVAVAEHERPSVGTVFRNALPVLPGVAAAEIVAAIGILIGFICFIVPGIYLAIRWAVVAQTAAYERTKWPTTISRSWSMTSRGFFHILGAVLIVATLDLLVASLVTGFVSSAGYVVQVVVLVIVGTLTQSFGALVLAILYFDLRAREGS